MLRFIRPTCVRNSPPPKPKKVVVGVLRRALDMQALLRQPGMGSRADLARALGVSRAHVSQTLAVLGVPPCLMEGLLRAEQAGRPVTLADWRRVKGLAVGDALICLRRLGYP